MKIHKTAKKYINSLIKTTIKQIQSIHYLSINHYNIYSE